MATVLKNEKYRVMDAFEIVDDTFQILDTDIVTYTEDGTVMQLYCAHCEDWMTSTKNVADARQARFSAKESFDELFWDVFPKEALDSLDKSCTYIFILLHVKNRIVIAHKENSLVFLRKVDLEGNEYEPEDALMSSKNVKRETAYTGSPDSKFRGYLVRRGEKYYICDSSEYTALKKLRGNTPDILYRYLLLSKNHDMRAFKLIGEYPESRKDIAAVNKKMYKTCVDIYNHYKCGTGTEPEYKKVIGSVYKAHGRLAEFQDVYKAFNKQPISVIYKSLVQK